MEKIFDGTEDEWEHRKNLYVSKRRLLVANAKTELAEFVVQFDDKNGELSMAEWYEVFLDNLREYNLMDLRDEWGEDSESQ